MQIFKNRVLTILLIALIVSALLIMYAVPCGTSAVLFVIALLIIIRSASSAAKKQENIGMWVDAEWHAIDEK